MTAGVYIHELATAGSLSANDYFVVDTGSAEVKLPFGDLQSQIMQGNYTQVADWDTFKPGATREIVHGYSTGGTATGVPISGDSITYYGWVEGVTAYCTQHIYTMYTASTVNRNRYWIRQCLNSTWGDWVEVTKTWWNHTDSVITNLNTVTESGVYTFSSGSTGLPAIWGDAGGVMLVMKTNATYIHQILYRTSTVSWLVIYHRMKNSDGWGDWYMEDVTGKSLQSGQLITFNLDDLVKNRILGVVWANMGNSSITGTKPYAGGQGIVMTLMQSTDSVRQVYIPMTANNYVSRYRYYTISTDTMSDWADSTLVGTVKSTTASVTWSPPYSTPTMVWKSVSVTGTIIGVTLASLPSGVAVCGTAVDDSNGRVGVSFAVSSASTTATVTLNVYYV